MSLVATIVGNWIFFKDFFLKILVETISCNFHDQSPILMFYYCNSLTKFTILLQLIDKIMKFIIFFSRMIDKIHNHFCNQLMKFAFFLQLLDEIHGFNPQAIDEIHCFILWSFDKILDSFSWTIDKFTIFFSAVYWWVFLFSFFRPVD